TDDAIGGGAAASITTTPAHTVTAYHNIIQQPAQLVITTIATPAIPADTSITPATPATPATPTTPEVVCSPGQMFRATDGAKCTSNTSSTQVFCPPGQMFNGTTGERCNTVINAGAPGASGYTFGSGVIKLGTKGEACRAWQHFFNDKAGASLVADGWCGKLTIAVAKAWQKSMGLVSDGLLGAMSRGKANQQ
ncbi:hypothetical protein COW91_02005, partial [Candidatus Nomurabacteria bacterium CG22_combo_CG10-13_8_21_14_all_32_8]